MKIISANPAVLVANFVNRTFDDLLEVQARIQKRKAKPPKILDVDFLDTSGGRAKLSYLLGQREDEAIRFRANADVLGPDTWLVATELSKYRHPAKRQELMGAMVDALDIQGLLTRTEYEDLSRLVARRSPISMTGVALAFFLDDSCEAFVNYLSEGSSEHLECELEKEGTESQFHTGGGIDLLDSEPRKIDPDQVNGNIFYRDPCFFFRNEFSLSDRGVDYGKVYLSSWVKDGEYVIEAYYREPGGKINSSMKKVVAALPEFIDKSAIVREKSVSAIESLGCFLLDDIAALREITADPNCYTRKTFELLEFLDRTHGKILKAKKDGVISTTSIDAPSKDVHVGFEILGLKSGEGILQARVLEEKREDPDLDRGVVSDDLDSFLSFETQKEVEPKTRMVYMLGEVAPYVDDEICDDANDIILSGQGI